MISSVHTARDIALSTLRLVLDRQPPYTPGKDMHDLARNGKIVLDLSNQTMDPLVEAMHDWRAFSWRVSQKVQYGPPYSASPNAPRARRYMQMLNP